MARKRKPEEPKKGVADYMATYGDMITLVLCFFVLLFSMSTIDAKKFEAMAASFMSVSKMGMQGSGGRETVLDLFGNGVLQMPSMKSETNADSLEVKKAEKAQEELLKMSSNFKTYFAENNASDQVQIEVKDNYMVVTVSEGVLFDRGRADLKAEAKETLSLVADKLIEYPDNEIEIEGHADNDPIKTAQFPSNWYLSSARAIQVNMFFIDEKGFDPSRCLAVGRGEYIPIAANDSLENKAKNRRVEIKVKSMEYSQD